MLTPHQYHSQADQSRVSAITNQRRSHVDATVGRALPQSNGSTAPLLPPKACPLDEYVGEFGGNDPHSPFHCVFPPPDPIKVGELWPGIPSRNASNVVSWARHTE